MSNTSPAIDFAGLFLLLTAHPDIAGKMPLHFTAAGV
jgi:hypothetical protein